MTVTSETFEAGMELAAYREQMSRNRERFEENEQSVRLDDDDLAWFRALPEPLNVLVITEDWCGDAIANVPVLARLAEESGRLRLRFFLRDQNPALMDQYLNDGSRSIPVFVFFDQEFQELGYWIERPAQMRALQEEIVEELYATDPAFEGVERGISIALLPEEARTRLFQRLGHFRTENRERSDREVVRELRALLEPQIVVSA